MFTGKIVLSLSQSVSLSLSLVTLQASFAARADPAPVPLLHGFAVGSDGRVDPATSSPPTRIPSSLCSPLARIRRRHLDPIVSPPSSRGDPPSGRREWRIRRPLPLPHGSRHLSATRSHGSAAGDDERGGPGSLPYGDDGDGWTCANPASGIYGGSGVANDGITCDLLLKLLRAGSMVGADAALLHELESRAEPGIVYRYWN